LTEKQAFLTVTAIIYNYNMPKTLYNKLGLGFQKIEQESTGFSKLIYIIKKIHSK
jgi:hypothetical protein